MSLSIPGFYGEKVYNDSGEAIPAFGVVQCSGFISFQGKEWFKVKKPDANGRIYFINGPFEIAASGDARTGNAANPFKSWGVEALFNPNLGPETNDALAPKAGQWYLDEAEAPADGTASDRWAVIVIGDVVGDAPSQPGLPSSPSTKRVRVAAVGGGASPGLRFGVLQATAAAATGVAKSQHGAGVAQFYNDDGTPEGSSRPIRNPFKDSFPNKCGCWFSMTDDPPEIVSVGCTLFA